MTGRAPSEMTVALLSRHCETGQQPVIRVSAILVLALVGILFCIGRI